MLWKKSNFFFFETWNVWIYVMIIVKMSTRISVLVIIYINDLWCLLSYWWSTFKVVTSSAAEFICTPVEKKGQLQVPGPTAIRIPRCSKPDSQHITDGLRLPDIFKKFVRNMKQPQMCGFPIHSDAWNILLTPKATFQKIVRDYMTSLKMYGLLLPVGSF